MVKKDMRKLYGNALTFLIIMSFIILISYSANALDVEDLSDDDMVLKFAYENLDESTCQYMSTQLLRLECIEVVKDRAFLEKGVEESKKTLENASSTDRRFLAKALLEKNPTMCGNIIDVTTRESCFKAIDPNKFNQPAIELKSGPNWVFIYSALFVIGLFFILLFIDIERKRNTHFDEDHEQLIKYIKSEFKRGMTEAKIRANLKRVGWKEHIIEKALKDAKKKK